MAMEKKYLVINSGSDSKKYALYSIIGGVFRELFRARFEPEDGGFVVIKSVSEESSKQKITVEEYEQSARYMLDCLLFGNHIKSSDEISATGFRVVAAGDFFNQPRIIGEEYKTKLTESLDRAPLHIGALLKEIENWESLLKNIPFVGISDSAFHSAMPRAARFYALAAEDSLNFLIYRYGYHGISVQSVVHTLEKMTGGIPSRVIVCHLGSGSSITAVKDGKSKDTSMGFTPLEGLPMRSRVGNIDAGAIIYLAKKRGLSLDQLEDYLNKNCGLLGLDKESRGDVRQLIEREKNGNKDAALALEIFVSGIKKYIGAYAALFGGVDLIVFTAAIGERSMIIRERVCGGLEFLGVRLDEKKNLMAFEQNVFINTDDSKVKIAVIKTDETSEIIKEMSVLLFEK